MNVPFGENADMQALSRLCPARNYHKCFYGLIKARYNVSRATLTPVTINGYSSSGECASATDRPFLVIGIPSAPTKRGSLRRGMARDTWIQKLPNGSLVCFIMSKQSHVLAEKNTIFVDAPESAHFFSTPPKYNRKKNKLGRGMPTFKQFAFFKTAIARWPGAKYIAKFDDDTLPNMPKIMQMLSSPYTKYALLGGIHWSAAIPKSQEAGVLIDRCAFGWNAIASLRNYGKTPWSVKGCDERGAVLPFPYAAGAGYIFSYALLSALTSSARVNKWVEKASEKTHEVLQWQKNEDLTTGYWLSYLALNISYVDMDLHDHSCTTSAKTTGLYRPSSPNSVLVHNLKCHKNTAYAWKLMQNKSYTRQECQMVRC